MKKLVSLLLTFVLTLSIAGCGASSDDSSGSAPVSDAASTSTSASSSASSSEITPEDVPDSNEPEVTPSPDDSQDTPTSESGSPSESKPAPAVTPDTLFQSDGTPTPDATVLALLNGLLRDDHTLLQTLFGYKSVDAVTADLFGGQTPREMILGSGMPVFDDTPVNEADFEQFITAYLDAISRSTISCKTIHLDEEMDTAVVSVTVNTYSVDTLERELAAALQRELTNNPDLANDAQAQVSLLVREMAKYLSALTPSSQTATIDVVCIRREGTLNGKTRAVWLPQDEYSLGEEIACAILPL